MSTWTLLTLSVAALVVLVLLSTFLFGGLSIITAPFRGEVAKNEKVEADGDYRIAAYDKFNNMCSDAESLQGQIENQETQADATSDSETRERLDMGVLGMRQELESIVNDYNTESEAKYTRGQFKSSKLPYQLDVDEEIECVN